MRKLLSKKSISAVIAVVTLVALLLTGTLAYVLNNQHRTSYLGTSKDGIFDLTLLNNFTSYSKSDWAKGESVSNPISIRSMPNTAYETYVDAYVAVQLKEYVGIETRGDWVKTSGGQEAQFAIDTDGDFMSYADAVAAGITDCVKYPATASDDDAFAIINDTQKAADQNAMLGIHGKPMREERATFTYGDKDALDAVRASGAQAVPSDECDATPINGWYTKASATSRDYVSFGFGNVMTLADWQALYAADAHDPALLGEFWILGDNGWAYWAQALAPNSRTATLINNIKLEKTVAEISYYLHVDMFTASLDQIDSMKTGAAMPNELVDAFKYAGGAAKLPDWAGEQGLTGTKEDIGKVFEADGNEWIVLNVDKYNNMLIISKNTLAYSRFGTVTQDVEYDSSLLKDSVAGIFDGLTQLKPFAMGANTPCETNPTLGDGADPNWQQYNQPGALSTCTNSKEDKTAFALSLSDFNTYFTGDLAQYAPATGAAPSWWLRTHVYVSSWYYSIAAIYPAGQVAYSSPHGSSFGVRPAMFIKLLEPEPLTVVEWAHDQGLTGTAADIGKIFEADDYEWIVLDVDENGNMLVLSKDMKVQSKFDLSSTVYAGSLLEQNMAAEFDTLTTLKDCARGVNTPTEEPWDWGRPGWPWDVGYWLEEGALSSCTNSATGATAFALSLSDLNKYLVGDMLDYRKATCGGTAMAWHTRTAQGAASNIATVGLTGSVSGWSYNSPNPTGLRPALYINIKI